MIVLFPNSSFELRQWDFTLVTLTKSWFNFYSRVLPSRGPPWRYRGMRRAQQIWWLASNITLHAGLACYFLCKTCQYHFRGPAWFLCPKKIAVKKTRGKKNRHFEDDTVDGWNPVNHLGCKNPINNGINYLSSGAGFQPSTVVHHFLGRGPQTIPNLNGREPDFMCRVKWKGLICPSSIGGLHGRDFLPATSSWHRKG